MKEVKTWNKVLGHIINLALVILFALLSFFFSSALEIRPNGLWSAISIVGLLVIPWLLFPLARQIVFKRTRLGEAFSLYAFFSTMFLISLLTFTPNKKTEYQHVSEYKLGHCAGPYGILFHNPIGHFLGKQSLKLLPSKVSYAISEAEDMCRVSKIKRKVSQKNYSLPKITEEFKTINMKNPFGTSGTILFMSMGAIEIFKMKNSRERKLASYNKSSKRYQREKLLLVSEAAIDLYRFDKILKEHLLKVKNLDHQQLLQGSRLRDPVSLNNLLFTDIEEIDRTLIAEYIKVSDAKTQSIKRDLEHLINKEKNKGLLGEEFHSLKKRVENLDI